MEIEIKTDSIYVEDFSEIEYDENHLLKLTLIGKTIVPF